MENKTLNQYESQKRDGVKIRLSRDKKWLIIKVPEAKTIIKPVAYFEKILERARSKISYDIEKIRG
mgnify:CR=1 FL=1